MKSFFAAIAFVAVALAAPAAFADNYVGVGIAQTQTSVEGFDLNEGTALDLTVGTEVVAPVVGALRVEGSVASLSSDTNIVGLNLGVDALEYSVSVFYDLPVGTNIRPYVGGGFNYTDGEADVLFTTVDASGFGYQLQGGFRAALTDTVTADVGVRWSERELDLEVYGSEFDASVEDLRLRVGFNVAL